MAKFSKKVEIVDAVVWDPSAKPTTYPDWMWNHLAIRPERFHAETGIVEIWTEEGGYKNARPGDYVIINGRMSAVGSGNTPQVVIFGSAFELLNAAEPATDTPQESQQVPQQITNEVTQ